MFSESKITEIKPNRMGEAGIMVVLILFHSGGFRKKESVRRNF